MNGGGGDRVGDTGAQGNDAGDVASLGGLADTAKDDFVDPLGVEAGPREEGGDGHPAQFVGAQRGKLRAHLAERSAYAIDNDQAGDVHVVTGWLGATGPGLGR